MSGYWNYRRELLRMDPEGDSRIELSHGWRQTGYLRGTVQDRKGDMGMERCTLCGGRLANGRCTECGLDNSKNDRKYHLNTHNEKATLFHRKGDCEDLLNRENKGKKRASYAWMRQTFSSDGAAERGGTSESRTRSGGRSGSSEGGARAGSRSGSSEGGARAGGRSGSSESGARAGSRSASSESRTRTAGQSGVSRQWSASRVVGGGSASEGRSAADSASRRRELKKRRQTGTVPRKRRGKAVALAMIVYALYILLSVASEHRSELTDFVEEMKESFGGAEAVREEERSRKALESIDLAKEGLPEAVDWEREGAKSTLLEMGLEPGYYVAGYDLEPGEYQLECTDGTAWVYWTKQDGDGGYACLYSPEDQGQYRESFGEPCEFGVYSERFSLAKNDVLYVENESGRLTLKGIVDPDAVLQDRETQGVPLSVELEDGMQVGKEFPAGVYDIRLASEKIDIHLSTASEEDPNAGFYCFLNGEFHTSMLRVPFSEGETVSLGYYSEEQGVTLVPSY